jgi:hypothetical protein
MTQIGTLRYTYEFLLKGVIWSNTSKLTIDDHIEAVVEPGSPIRLLIIARNTDFSSAAALCERYAREFYTRLVLRFAATVESAPPFPTPAIVRELAGVAGMSCQESVNADACIAASVTQNICKPAMDAVASETAQRLQQPPLSGSLPESDAVEMFLTALQIDNQTVRFLIIYSSLALAAISRVARGKQEDIDSLLLSANPVLPETRHPKRNYCETVYTKVRNDFIHAEDRGSDPERAIVEMRREVMNLQRDAARVLLE